MKKLLPFLVALFAFSFQNLNAQTRIISGHPDFNIKVNRCVANGKSVFLDLVLNNEGINDIERIKLWISSICGAISCYDDQGNICNSDLIYVKVANLKEYRRTETNDFKILSGVPMKISIRIDDFSISAESIARITLPFECSAWGLNSEKPAKIYNIPINRD